MKLPTMPLSKSRCYYFSFISNNSPAQYVLQHARNVSSLTVTQQISCPYDYIINLK